MNDTTHLHIVLNAELKNALLLVVQTLPEETVRDISGDIKLMNAQAAVYVVFPWVGLPSLIIVALMPRGRVMIADRAYGRCFPTRNLMLSSALPMNLSFPNRSG